MESARGAILCHLARVDFFWLHTPCLCLKNDSTGICVTCLWNQVSISVPRPLFYFLRRKRENENFFIKRVAWDVLRQGKPDNFFINSMWVFRISHDNFFIMAYPSDKVFITLMWVRGMGRATCARVCACACVLYGGYVLKLLSDVWVKIAIDLCARV